MKYGILTSFSFKRGGGLDQNTGIKFKHLHAEFSIHTYMYCKCAHSKTEGNILKCNLCINAPGRKHSLAFQGNQIGLDLIKTSPRVTRLYNLPMFCWKTVKKVWKMWF